MKMTKNSTLSLHIKTVAFCAACLLLTNTAQACRRDVYDFEVKNNGVYWGYDNRTGDAAVTFKFKGKTIKPDAASFKSFGVIDYSRPAYSKDKAHVFYGFNVVPKADPRSFQPLGDYYGKDKSRVFYAGVEMIGADAASFEPLFPDYKSYTRNAHADVKGITWPPFDADSFKLWYHFVYTSDKNAVYYHNSKIQEANPVDVRFEQDYLISNHKVFKDGKKLDFDADSFKVVERKFGYELCDRAPLVHETLQDKNGQYSCDGIECVGF